MAINPNIILGIQPTQFKTADPMDSVQKSLALQALMGQGDLQALQLDEARRGADTNQRLQALFRDNPNATPDDVMRIDPAKGLKMRADLLANRKTEGDIAKTEAEVAAARAKLGRDLIASASPENYATVIAEGRRLGQKWADTAPAAFDPVWQRQNVIGADKWLEVNTPKPKSVNDGKVTRFVDENPFTNPSIVGQTIAMQTTPGEDQTDQRTRSEGDKNRGVTVRGQNMVDTRARETLQAGGRQFDSDRGVIVNTREGTASPVMVDGKPLEPKDNAPEAERIASGFAKRMFEATKILGPLEDAGVGKPGVVESVARAVPMVGKVGANLASSDERQKYRQAQEDWVRAKLRKESGAVIGDEEMDREIRVYFPQIGDKPDVVKQKARARTTAENAMVEAAGRAWRRSGGAAQNTPTGEGGPIKISGDDGYRMLKSGDRYIGPDGVERVKP